MAKNLWPDFDISQRPRTIKRVLLEAGAGVAEKTEEVIKFVVDTRVDDGKKFVHVCYLSESVPKACGAGFQPAGLRVFRPPGRLKTGPTSFWNRLSVPQLAFRYPFLQARHGFEQYPVEVDSEILSKTASAGNETELVKLLGQIFRSDDIKKMVVQLLDAVS